MFSEVCDGGGPAAPPCVLNDDARIFKGIFARYLVNLVPALQRAATAPAAPPLPPPLARSLLSSIAAFLRFNLDFISSDIRNAAAFAVCGNGTAPMPRPRYTPSPSLFSTAHPLCFCSPGVRWQSARESVFAGYTSTLSALDLAIAYALVTDLGYA